MRIDDLIEIYENDKREKTIIPKYVYDLNKSEFLSTRKAAKECKLDIDICENTELGKELFRNGYALFINAYTVCSNIIRLYLEKYCTEEDINHFRLLKKSKNNIIVPFLWYFDDKDGLESFEKFENKKLLEIMSAWCEKFNIKLEQ